MIVKTPPRAYHLGEDLPPIGMPILSWPWGPSEKLTSFARGVLSYPLGTIILATVDGHPVVAQIQTHYNHPDWGPGGNKGASVYVPTTAGPDGHLRPIADPPQGWGEEASFGVEGVSVAAIEAIVREQEDRARAAASKIPKGLTTVGGAGIGFVLGGPPGALLGGLIGLGADLWGHLSGPTSQSPSPVTQIVLDPKGGVSKVTVPMTGAASHSGDRTFFRIYEYNETAGKGTMRGTVVEADDADEAAWIAARRYFASKSADSTSLGPGGGSKVYETEKGHFMLVEKVY